MTLGDAAIPREPRRAIRETVLADLVDALSVNGPPGFVVRSGQAIDATGEDLFLPDFVVSVTKPTPPPAGDRSGLAGDESSI